MTTLQEALPCPFCGKQHTLQVISGQELMGEDQEFWQHSESFGVVCDASTPDGKGGCGAMGGFKPTEDEAIEAWNTRTALAQQGEPVAWAIYDKRGGSKSIHWAEQHTDGNAEMYNAVPLYKAAPAPQAHQGEPPTHERVYETIIQWDEGGGKRSRRELTRRIEALYAGVAPAPVEQRCTYCDGTGDVHSIDGEWRGTCHCAAAPALQPAQGVGRTNPGDETGGAVERFGLQTFLGKSPEIIPATNGSFVWYSDYLKLWQSAQPVAQPRDLTDEEILSLEKQTPAMNDAGGEWIYFARAVLKKARE